MHCRMQFNQLCVMVAGIDAANQQATRAAIAQGLENMKIVGTPAVTIYNRRPKRMRSRTYRRLEEKLYPRCRPLGAFSAKIGQSRLRQSISMFAACTTCQRSRYWG